MRTRLGAYARSARRYVLVPALACLALTAWALSNPVGASPDEDYHLSSIWCGQGIESGVCEKARASDERMVDEFLPQAPLCFQFQPQMSAACQAPLFVNRSERLIPTDRGNFSGDYPPGFYFVMHSFIGDDISRSVVLMRAFNAALFVGLVTALYWLLPRGRRAMAVLGTVVALVPLGVSIIPSINPSSWAVTSSALVFPAVVGFFETSGRRRLALAALAGAATLMAASARADAAVYAALAAVLAVVLTSARRSKDWRLVPFPLLLVAVCLASYLSSGQTAAATAGFDAAVGSDGHSAAVPDSGLLIGQNLLNVPELWAGSFGFGPWGLGWLDTRMPAVVWVVNLAIFGAVLFVGLRQLSPRKTAAVLLTLGGAWALPTLVLVQSSAVVGTEVQPRYLLPLLVLLAHVALFRVDPDRGDLTRPQLTLLAVGLTATNATALHFNIRRYVTGTDVFAPNLDAGREWWWGFALSPMQVWLLGSVAFGAVLFAVVRSLARGDAGVRGDALPESPSTREAVGARSA